MPLMEPNYYALWIGKQTAKGTPNTTPGQRLVQVGGDMSWAREDGSENYSDLTKYGARTDWVNSLTGSGEPIAQATPTELAYLLWLYHGGETVTAVTGPPAASKHTFVPATTKGHWCTVFARVGSTVIRRHQHNDCLLTRFALEASTANKAARITTRVLSLDPGVVYATDPVKALPSERPFLHTDLSANAGATSDGSLTIDGTVFRGVSQWSMAVDDAWDVVYGDDVVPYEFTQGTPTVNVGATFYADAQGYQQFCKLAYGTATPAAGTKPLRSIPALGSFAPILRQRDSAGAYNGLELNGVVPGVKWTLPDAPAPNPDGGTTEIALAGEMRPVAGQPAYTLNVQTPSAVVAFTT